MKIKSIKAIAVNLSPNPKTQPRVELDANGGYFVNPMDRYKYDIKYRSSTNWNRVACVVTAEEHMLNGGLGDSIAQLLGRELPIPIEMIGVDDSFGESGSPMQLMKKYGLSSSAIIKASRKVISRK